MECRGDLLLANAVLSRILRRGLFLVCRVLPYLGLLAALPGKGLSRRESVKGCDTVALPCGGGSAFGGGPLYLPQ
jgi:hypothetical protein